MSEKKLTCVSYVPTHVRLLREQYEWLRQYSYENRVPQAEVIRKALEMYRQAVGSAKSLLSGLD